MINIQHGDCLHLMYDIPFNSVDMILCDLPYGTTQCKWDAILPFTLLWRHYDRLIKDNRAVVLTATEPFASALVMSNPDAFRYSWVWIKSKTVNALNAQKMPMRKHEIILVFSNGSLPNYYPQDLIPFNKIVDNTIYSEHYNNIENKERYQEYTNYPNDVLEFNSPQRTQHPTQKPVELFEYLIKTYTKEGDLVLDSCAGSGTTGVACENLNRECILIEKDAEYIKIIESRCNRSPEQRRLDMLRSL